MNEFANFIEYIITDISIYKMECFVGFITALFFSTILYGFYNKILGEEMKREIRKKIDVMDQQIDMHKQYNEYYEKLLNYLHNDITELREELIESNDLITKYKTVCDDLEQQIYMSNDFIEQQNRELQSYKDVTTQFYRDVREIREKFADPIIYQQLTNSCHQVMTAMKAMRPESIPELIL